MRINGKWFECADGKLRPVIDGVLLDTDNRPESFPFLVDLGADSTVLNYTAVAYSGVEVRTGGSALQGVTGSVESVIVDTTFWILSSAGDPVPMNGPFLGHPYPTGDEYCILGRDLLGHFAVVVDRPGNVVCLLSGRHRYIIQES